MECILRREKSLELEGRAVGTTMSKCISRRLIKLCILVSLPVPYSLVFLSNFDFAVGLLNVTALFKGLAFVLICYL